MVKKKIKKGGCQAHHAQFVLRINAEQLFFKTCTLVQSHFKKKEGLFTDL